MTVKTLTEEFDEWFDIYRKGSWGVRWDREPMPPHWMMALKPSARDKWMELAYKGEKPIHDPGYIWWVNFTIEHAPRRT